MSGAILLDKKGFEAEREKLFVKYKVRIAIREGSKLIANFPDNIEALKYIVQRQKREDKLTDEEAEKLQAEMEEDAVTSIEETTGKCIFLKDEKGIYIRPRHIKGMLKEVVLRCMNMRGGRDYINHAIHVTPDKIYLMRNGEVIKQPDKVEAYPISVMTRQGRRSSVKVMEVLYPPVEAEFWIWIPKELARSKFTEEVMKKMMIYASEVGLLGERSLGEGKFDIIEMRRA